MLNCTPPTTEVAGFRAKESMSYENTNGNYTVTKLGNMISGGLITFENVIQRSYVWEKKRRSLLIHSLLVDCPIGEIYAKRIEVDKKKKYDVLDGQQRLTTIYKFINNGFVLSELPEVTVMNDLTGKKESYDVTNLTFDKLPDILQRKIIDTNIKIIYFDNLTKDEEVELFKRLNNGKPLTPKARSLASCNNIERLLEIGKHRVFQEALTISGRHKKEQCVILMKCWMMLNMNIDDVTFLAKKFNPMLEKAEMSKDEEKLLIAVLDLMDKTHQEVKSQDTKVGKKMYRDLHLVSLAPFFAKAIEKKVSAKKMADWVLTFYSPDDKISISDEYNEASKQGTATTVSIKARNDALAKHYKTFIGG